MAERASGTEAIGATTAIRVIGVVGAGTMGAGIAQLALEAGHEVRLHDADVAALERGRVRIADGLARRAGRTSGSDAGPDAPRAHGRLTTSPSVAALADGADLVIEAVVEDLAVKQELFRTLGGVASDSAILATNTSALSVAAVGSTTARPQRVLGLHFFNPAPVMRLVEVVAPAGVDPTAVERAQAAMTDWGKTPVVCADSPGFIVNRVNRPFTLEALRLLEDGVASVDRIDGAVRGDGFPMGPFELMDLIGVDVNLAVARALYEAFGRAERFRPSPIQEQLVADGTLGRKTGTGFHGGAADRFPPPDPAGETDPDLDRVIVERIVLAIVNEAYRALGDGVASVADIDLALRLGAGHPIGPFERVERLGGAPAVLGRLDHLARAVGPRFEPAEALVASARRTPTSKE